MVIGQREAAVHRLRRRYDSERGTLYEPLPSGLGYPRLARYRHLDCACGVVKRKNEAIGARMRRGAGQRRPCDGSVWREQPPVYVLHGGSTREAGTLMDSSELLVIGAGPYGVAIAARAIERGIETIVVGGPMSFWKQHMPEGMCLRSGPDWHLDAAGVHTFEAFLEEEGIAPNDIDPVPIRVFLDYATWFQDNKGVVARENLVTRLTHEGTVFEALLESGERITADAVVAAPGIRHFQQLPSWADSVPPGVAAHTGDVVDFEDLRGARGAHSGWPSERLRMGRADR